MGLLARAKKLDDRAMARWSGAAKPFADRAVQFGAIWVLLFGGGLLLRLSLLPWMQRPAYELWTYAGLTAPGLLLLAHGIHSHRRDIR